MTRQRFSLRARLVVTLLVLAVAGLALTGLVINTQLSNYLIARTDQQLKEGVPTVAQRLLNEQSPGPGPGGGRPPAGSFPADSYGAVYNDSGALIAGGSLSIFSTDPVSRPTVTTQDVQNAAASGSTFLTVSGTGNVASYRVLLEPVRGGVIEVAIPLTEIDATLTQLLWLEIAVGLVVVALLGGAAYLLIRAELKPLEQMSDTAAEIAAGDLSKRVDETAGGTEVGQLGAALNVMLGRIEEAFAARQASEERLRQFVADASHELRTPLTSIRGYSEMFERGAAESPEDLDTMMRRIQQESKRMSGLVDDLLMLARLDEQRPMDREPVDLAQVVRDVGLDVAASAPDHPLTVDAPAEVWTEGDSAAITQVVANLARNAWVHTPAGTPLLLSASAHPGWARVEVSDRGPGIPPDIAPKVFERFTRADASRGRDSGGAGLGLSIVAAIVDAHGGRIDLTEQ